jgi:hypothetical protein
MRVEKTNKAFAYRVPIGDYNYLQCRSTTDYQLMESDNARNVGNVEKQKKKFHTAVFKLFLLVSKS